MMLLGPSMRVFAMGAAVDMRRGFEGLWALATHQMGHDVLAGDLFLFVGRDRKRCKVVFFDGTGVCLLHKRLSKLRPMRDCLPGVVNGRVGTWRDRKADVGPIRTRWQRAMQRTRRPR